MIVDLLRNDLSRIAEPGSVSVPALFDVTRHGDVLQMTSTVEATAKANLSLQELLNAVFPCGSVTGAPKKRSMELIQALEPSPRNYYCGGSTPMGILPLAYRFALLISKKIPKQKKRNSRWGLGLVSPLIRTHSTNGKSAASSQALFASYLVQWVYLKPCGLRMAGQFDMRNI
jgi:anthranilate/para-aminobenzoate synthase component I